MAYPPGNLSCYAQSPYSVTTCDLPTERTRESHSTDIQAYCRETQPIKGIRLVQPAARLQGCGPWTNLRYHPLVQGGLWYNGVDKLVPIGPPPSSPVLCRPTPPKPTGSPGIIVYSAP